MKTRACLHPIAVSLISLCLAPQCAAQAVATASGPGGFLAVGGGASAFQADYGHRDISGAFVFADVNPQWRVGLEGEARYLRFHADEDVTESSYLGGLRIALLPSRSRLQPYAKFLAGMGRITLPYGYAHGAFLTYAPGAGLDLGINERWTVRALDVEFQHWPQFTYGALSPYGLSTGVSFRLNPVSHYPRGLRMRR